MISAIHAVERPTLLTWTQVLVFVTILAVTLMPFDTPILVGGALVVQAFWIARDHDDLWLRLRHATATPGWIAVVVFLLYLVVRLLPPPLPIDALGGVLAFGLIAAMSFATISLFAHQNEDVQRAIAYAIVAAFVTAAAIHAFEVSTGFALRRLVWTWLPLLRPRPGKFDVDNGIVRDVVVYIANPTSAVLLALFWPTLLMHRMLPASRRRDVVVVAGILFCAYALMRSDQATSKMALAAGAVTWVTVTLMPRLTRTLLLALWIGSNALVLPVAWYAYDHHFYQSSLNFSARHRVVLWGVTAEKTFEHPVFGIGTGRTPEHDESGAPNVKTIPGTTIPIATNRHAHNVYLQLWYEDGLVGVVLFVLIGVSVIAWIMRAPMRAQPLLAAAFVAAIISASFSYSLLAAWFVASFAITALFARFAVGLSPPADHA